MENLPVAKEQGGAVINYADPKMIATLKATVATGLTNEEFQLFSQFCSSTGLNPFKREIWAIKAGGRLQLMTGINGFFAIANSHPQFDGHESGLVDEKGNYATAAYPGKYLGAWARVHRKDRKIPTEAVAMLDEYDKGQGNWPKMRRVMITKCAESVALRKAFPQELNGLYTQEEMPTEYSAKTEVQAVSVNGTPQAPKQPEQPKQTFTYSCAILKTAQMSKETAKAIYSKILKAGGKEVDGLIHSPIEMEEIAFALHKPGEEGQAAPEPQQETSFEDDDIPFGDPIVPVAGVAKEDTPLAKAQKRAKKMTENREVA